MLKASIDIGSNSTLLLIADVVDLKIIKTLENEANVTSLGKDLDKNKLFIQESMDETFRVLNLYKNLIDKHMVSIENVFVSATEASRVAHNSKEFYEKVKSEIGLNVQIINSLGEAYYTAFGVFHTAETTQNDVTIMDIGGASTELISVKKNPFCIHNSLSLPVGSVRATDWIESGCLKSNLEKLDFKEINKFKTKNLICVAGSMTSLGAMFKELEKYDDESVNGAQIDFSSFESFVSKISGLSGKEILKKYPFLGKRAKSIAGGALVSLEIAKKLDVSTLEVSTSGLRYGTILSGGIDGKYIN